MNEIRLNKEEEKEIAVATFKVPPILIAIFILLALHALLFVIVGIILLGSPSDSSNSATLFIGVGVPMLVIGVPLFIAWMVGIEKCKCIVTNKRIYGVTNIFVAKKNYSYRLDEIESVETVSTMGAHGLALNFSQGHGPKGTVKINKGVATVSGEGVFKINNIANIDDVYDKLVGLLTSIKNDKDLMVDIEMSKVDAENRKAAAFENMATKMGDTSGSKPSSNQNYIEELKGLKELLDAGIISPEEFEAKKKKLLA